MSRWTRIGTGAVLAALAVGYLFWTGLSESMVATRTVPEFLEHPQGRARVTGSVKTTSVLRDRDGGLHFVLAEDGEEIRVTYTDTVPDMFAEGRPVVVEGRMEPGGVFHADTLLTKCPSKYEGMDEEGHPTDIPTGSPSTSPATSEEAAPEPGPDVPASPQAAPSPPSA